MRKLLLSCLLAGLFLTACEQERLSPYAKQVKRDRYSKDSVLKWNIESPFGGQDRIDFVQLNYYKPDENYRVEATIQKFENPDTILIPNGLNRTEKYLRFAKLKFELNGNQSELVVYQQHRLLSDGGNKNHLFLPFWDATNGEETYDAGRYIDLEYNGKDKITIDFNYAYNPYCAYSYEYTCPVPPEENRLTYKVEAGEKTYKPETGLMGTY